MSISDRDWRKKKKELSFKKESIYEVSILSGVESSPWNEIFLSIRAKTSLFSLKKKLMVKNTEFKDFFF